jgi:hypothetical protein
MTTELIVGALILAVGFIASIVRIRHDILKINKLTKNNEDAYATFVGEMRQQREMFMEYLDATQQSTLEALHEMADSLNQHTQQLAKHDAKLDTLEKIITKEIK